jgi:signal transduction histidine kinase
MKPGPYGGVPRLARYGVALLSVGLALVTRLALAPVLGDRLPFLTFFLAVIVSGWLGGLGPGLLAVVTSIVANRLVFGAVDPTRAVAYLVVTTVIVVIYGSLHAAKERAEAAHERELAARGAAEAARERTAFLADGNVALTASLDYVQTLSALADLVVPRLADWCAVDAVEVDGTIRRVAARHRNPAKAEITRATAVFPADPDGRHPRTEVIRTGRSRVMVEVTDELLGRIAADAEHLRVMRQLGYVSAMIVPLVARGRTIGAITCAITESTRRYGTEDLKLAEEVALRAALALDNARLYHDAEAARAEAQQANRAKDQFLSVVSHELKTPLASTLGWLRVLRSGNGDHSGRGLASIERSVRVQARLIDDLLDVSRMVMGRVRVDRQPVELAALVAAAADTIRPEADTKGVRLDVTTGLPPIGTTGDPERLQQIVWNLLSNAVKFTPTGGHVQVRLAPHSASAELVVEDDGAGIDAAFLPHVFDDFRQAEPVNSRAKGGLGIGLTITRHLVELHGGTIAVASAGRDRGATFTVVLPLTSPAARSTPEPTDSGTPLDGSRSA